MLVLSRNIGETLVLTLPDGREVNVTVVDIGRGKVRIGIEAPRDVPVFREELLPEGK